MILDRRWRVGSVGRSNRAHGHKSGDGGAAPGAMPGTAARMGLAALIGIATWIAVPVGANPGDVPEPAADEDEPRIAWRFGSIRHQVPLLEVFTSQECNSCPPVEQFLNGLAGRGYGPDKVVVLTWHVSYWPHLGWTDRFALPASAERHAMFNEELVLSGPYTPQVMLNGRERRERGNDLLAAIDGLGQRPPAARLRMLVEMPARSRNVLEIYGEFDRSTVNQKEIEVAQVIVAVFEMGLTTKVEAGENRGRTLREDYVVRRLASAHEVRVIDHILHLGTQVGVEPGWNVDRLGVAAFVQVKRDRKIYQATAGLLDPKTARPADP